MTIINQISKLVRPRRKTGWQPSRFNEDDDRWMLAASRVWCSQISMSLEVQAFGPSKMVQKMRAKSCGVACGWMMCFGVHRCSTMFCSYCKYNFQGSTVKLRRCTREGDAPSFTLEIQVLTPGFLGGRVTVCERSMEAYPEYWWQTLLTLSHIYNYYHLLSLSCSTCIWFWWWCNLVAVAAADHKVTDVAVCVAGVVLMLLLLVEVVLGTVALDLRLVFLVTAAS